MSGLECYVAAYESCVVARDGHRLDRHVAAVRHVHVDLGNDLELVGLVGLLEVVVA